MIRIALLGLTLCSLASCAPPEPTKEEQTIEEAKASVRAKLRDPESALFENVRLSPKDPLELTVCGTVNAKNGFGGYVGRKPFVVIYGSAYIDTDPPPALLPADRGPPCD